MRAYLPMRLALSLTVTRFSMTYSSSVYKRIKPNQSMVKFNIIQRYFETKESKELQYLFTWKPKFESYKLLGQRDESY